MRIGQFAERTGVPSRLLRYYEDQGLLEPRRADNGYRDYPESMVDRVVQIRGLLDAGLPIRIIKDILPSLDDPTAIHVIDADPELIATLEAEREQMDARIRCLTRNRDGLTAYLTALRGAAQPAAGRAARYSSRPRLRANPADRAAPANPADRAAPANPAGAGRPPATPRS